MKKNTLLITLLSLGSLSVLAEDVQFINIRAGGSGCPSEKTTIVYAPNNSTASIIFSDFSSKVPQEITSPKVNPAISQLPCNLFLEVKLPIGQKLDSLEIKYDMRGSAMLDQGVVGMFRSYIISALGLGVERTRGRAPELVQEKKWANSSVQQFDDFTLQSTQKIIFNSECTTRVGSDKVAIHLQHHLLTQIINGKTDGSARGVIMVDTSDVSGGLKIHPITSACNNGGKATPQMR